MFRMSLKWRDTVSVVLTREGENSDFLLWSLVRCVSSFLPDRQKHQTVNCDSVRSTATACDPTFPHFFCVRPENGDLCATLHMLMCDRSLKPVFSERRFHYTFETILHFSTSYRLHQSFALNSRLDLCGKFGGHFVTGLLAAFQLERCQHL